MNQIKRFLKRIDILKRLWRRTNIFYEVLLTKVSPVLASKRLYRRQFGQSLDLENPKDFNEKLMWLKLFWRHPLVSKCADKYAVREYVKARGCDSALNVLYGVYDTVDEIEWDKLPNRFALKCTHGCGSNIICEDKSKLQKEEVFDNLRKWMNTNYSYPAAEIHYSSIKPRIIFEKFIENRAGPLPIDYKIYCFNGVAKIILVCSDRSTDLKLDWVDLQWNRMDIGAKRLLDEPLPQKPDCLSAMLDYAERLAKPFPFVRVDFYDNNSVPVLGELTFTPYGCIAPYYNKYGLQLLGDMLFLPKKLTRRSLLM